MNAARLLDLWRGALVEVAAAAAPFLVTALVVGIVVALFQTATQIQEASLSFTPKLVAALVVLGLGGHLVLDRLVRYTETAFAVAAEPQEPQP